MAKKDIGVRLDEENVVQIDELAAKLGLSRSATTAILISQALKHFTNISDVIKDAQS